MSEQTKQVLKGYYVTGATPTEAQFADLIDSMGLQSETDANTAITQFITITQAVDLDQMETDVTANNDKNTYPPADATKVGFITVTAAADLDQIETNRQGIDFINVTTIPALATLINDNTIAIGLNTTKLSGIEDNATENVPSTDTGATTSIINLGNTSGFMYTGASGAAKSVTTYTTTGETIFGFAMVLINTSSEPTVTGATKISGADWVTGTNMYLVIWNNGTRTEYFFLSI